jgi:hypothetical protein
MPIIGTTGSQNTKSFLNPNAPTIGTATDVGTGRAYNNGAATVTFTPAPTGAAATSFTVTSSPGGFTGTGASSPITVTGLQSNTSYTFTVVATNSVGPSAASAASNSITATTVPQAPTIGTATKNTSAVGQINVAFTANANGGKSVTTFTASRSGGTHSGASSPILATGLTPGTSYTFTVTATNANGTSSASASSNSVAASQYTCPSGGSVSGSSCVLGASTATGYQCPSGGQVLIEGCSDGPGDIVWYRGDAYYCSRGSYGTVRCCYAQYPQNPGGSWSPDCTTYTYYYCNTGTLSGSQCFYPASIG